MTLSEFPAFRFQCCTGCNLVGYYRIPRRQVVIFASSRRVASMDLPEDPLASVVFG